MTLHVTKYRGQIGERPFHNTDNKALERADKIHNQRMIWTKNMFSSVPVLFMNVSCGVAIDNGIGGAQIGVA